MSHDTDWDVDKYREEHESAEQWELRRAFIEKWKNKFPEERLICLARVFANMEFLGCRYPSQLMREVAELSKDIAKEFREKKKGKLQRTFVSASDAAEDRARGIKRKGGVIEPSSSTKIKFVAPGQIEETNEVKPEVYEISDDEEEPVKDKTPHILPKSEVLEAYDYVKDLKEMNCLPITCFRDTMFDTPFGKLVLLVRPWTTKLGNIQASCSACRINQIGQYNRGIFSIYINDTLVAEASGATKAEARSIAETIAWARLIKECVCIIFKEQWRAQNDAPITAQDVSGKPMVKEEEFGTPIESSVASHMMKMMGWSGGGLGANAQGIAEPIKPHLQMVKRAGLGSDCRDIQMMKRSANDLMRRYASSDCLDVDLVFSNDFNKEERATLHQIAKRYGLASHSYGKDDDRFLVVKQKLDPFSLFHAVIAKGGETPKFEVIIPYSMYNQSR